MRELPSSSPKRNKPPREWPRTAACTQSFDGYVCNGEEGLVIPKSNMLSNGNNMKLPIESSSQFVRTNPKPSIESYYHKHIPMKYAQILRANSAFYIHCCLHPTKYPHHCWLKSVLWPPYVWIQFLVNLHVHHGMRYFQPSWNIPPW